MNKEQKQSRIEELKSYFSQYGNFYVIDTESLTVAQINTLRRACFNGGVTFKVAKNTLIKRALSEVAVNRPDSVNQAFHGVSALLFSENPKTPATIITEFRSKNLGDLPKFKVALIDTDAYVGEAQLEVLKKLKTKQELLGELVGLLQSPTTKLLGALKSGADTIGSLVKALEQRA